MTSFRNVTIALAAILGFGCSGGSGDDQVITGTITTANAVAVRAVAGSDVVAAGAVRTDGSFTLALPGGKTYRLEVLDATGTAHHVVGEAGGAFTEVAFRVCRPGAPWDVGGVGDGTGSGSGMGGCDGSGHGGPGGGSGSGSGGPDGSGTTPPPPPPGGGGSGTGGGPPPPCTDPTTCDPGGMPPPPPPCTDPTTCDPDGGMPPCTDPTTCDPGGMAPPDGGTYPPPPPPCTDPMDPSTCQDPCMDPASCGCAAGDDSCWPPPGPPCDPTTGSCDPSGGMGGMMPDHPPHDFGCDDASGSD